MDFQQDLITTIHDYGIFRDSLLDLRKSLKNRPTTLLIPCLFDEFKRPALASIREVLKELDGLHQLVIALSASSSEEASQAKSFFANMPFPVHVQWTNSPAVIELLTAQQERNGLELLVPPGKGWAVWQGLGVATKSAEIVGLFDADIKTFSPSYPSRMLQPLLDPSYGISYVKAFYSRLSLENNSLQGRATRLFVGPLLSSLEQVLGESPFIKYLQAFRYPLAGEFAFTKSLALNLRIPYDWGLEIGLLSEIYRHVRTNRIAQVDLGIFDHKHKDIGDSKNDGLQKMCCEILSTILKGLMEHQSQTLSNNQLSTLQVLYNRIGEDRVKQFGLDSIINKLPYSRHTEELSVQRFAELIKPTACNFLDQPNKNQLPAWSRVLNCDSRLQDDLINAGSEKSNKQLKIFNSKKVSLV
tara:strand:+ start:4638 stop:5879 length:1242 start_codon:yes stop_codon:yes gene_type:complete